MPRRRALRTASLRASCAAGRMWAEEPQWKMRACGTRATSVLVTSLSALSVPPGVKKLRSPSASTATNQTPVFASRA